MKRFIPLLIILFFMALAYFTGITNYLTYDSLKENRAQLMELVASHPYLAPILYVAVYTLSTALSVPGALFLSIFGGFLFPQPLSTLYVVIGATMGAIIVFLAAKTAFGESMKNSASPLLNKMQKGLKDGSASYLLFLRLVPLFPFWMVNLAPAFFGVSLVTFAWTTFVGIMPGAFVFTQTGAGLSAILDSGETLSLNEIFNFKIKIAFAALGLFLLIPNIIKKLKS